MAKRRTIAIEVVLDEKGVVKGIRGIDGSLKGLARTSDKTAKAGFNLGRAFEVGVGNLMAVAVANAGRAVRGLVRAGAQLVGQSADIVETQNKLSAVFGDSTDQVEKFIEQYANMAGVTENAAKELLATTGAILSGSGFAKGAAAEMTIAITRLAGDITSFSNVPLEETLGAINSALVGERERLKQLGVVILETDVQQRALADTGKESVKQLTRQEKATATLALIQKQASFAAGDLAKTQGEAAGQMRQFGARIRELRDDFALELLPTIVDVSTELNEFLKDPELSEFAKKLGESISDALLTAIDTIKSTITFLKTFSGEVKAAAEVVAVLGVAMIAYRAAAAAAWFAMDLYTSSTTLATIATRIFNTVLKLNPIGLFVGALVTGLIIVQKWTNKMRDAADTTNDYVENLADAKKAIEDLTEAQKKQSLDEAIQDMIELANATSLAREKFADLDVKLGRFGILSRFGTGEAIRLTKEIKKMEERAAKLAARIVALRGELAGEDAGGGGGEGGGTEDPAEEFDRGRFDEQMEAARLRVEAEQEMFAALREARQEDFAFQLELDAEMDAHKAEQLAKEKALSDKRKLLIQQEVDANRSAIAAMISADDESIESAEDAAVAIARSVRRIVKAKLAQAIATAIATEARKGIFALVTGAIVAAGLTLLFNKFLPSFEHGGRNIAAGMALVGEKGPEIVHLPQGSSVIPAPQTARAMAGHDEPTEIFGVLNGEDIFLSSKRAGNRLDRMGHA